MAGLFRNWRRAFAAMRLSSRRAAGAGQRPGELEQDRQSPGAEYETLAGKLDLLRAELEHRDLALARLRESLEQGRRLAGTEHSEVERQLTELGQRVAAIAGGHAEALGRVAALEASLAESVQRLDTRCNQLKFLQDSERGQFSELRTALAEAASRLETRDDGLSQRLDGMDERIGGIETTQQEVVARLQAVDDALEELRTGQLRLARQSDASHAAVTHQLEAAGKLVTALDEQVGQVRHAQQEMRSGWEARYARIRMVQVATIIAVALVVVYLLV